MHLMQSKMRQMGVTNTSSRASNKSVSDSVDAHLISKSSKSSRLLCVNDADFLSEPFFLSNVSKGQSFLEIKM